MTFGRSGVSATQKTGSETAGSAKGEHRRLFQHLGLTTECFQGPKMQLSDAQLSRKTKSQYKHRFWGPFGQPLSKPTRADI